MLAVRERQPQTATTVPRPLARILRDFEDAIERADLAAAANLVTEATATGRLSLVNQSLLESRILVASGDSRPPSSMPSATACLTCGCPDPSSTT